MHRQRIIMLTLLLSIFRLLPVMGNDSAIDKRIAAYVTTAMKDAHIPGISLVWVSDGQPTIRCYGMADIGNGEKVSPSTLFQLGSCSKAFTALAIMQLQQGGWLGLDDPVSKYIPWLQFRYKNKEVPVSIGQLLHHTSGVPWRTISKIPVADGEDALEKTVRQLVGQELGSLPGKKYEYATINYDVLALIIQNIVHRPFEEYVRKNIMDPLGLTSTTIGAPKDDRLMAKGYKMGFFRPRPYQPPSFKGNNAAGYVISNAEDMGRWLRFQLGLTDEKMFQQARMTQMRDETVSPHDMSFYAMGWDATLDGTGGISHSGLNPNFTSYIGLRPTKKTGVVVLANSNSNYTAIIGANILKLLAGEEITKDINADDGTDRAFSIISMVLGVYCLIVMAFLVNIIIGIMKRRRIYTAISPDRIGKFASTLLPILPLLYGLYILPKVMGGFSWAVAMVWTPASFEIAVGMILLSIGLSYLVFFITMLFPQQHPFKRIAPPILLMSVISGIANMLLIVLITSALNSAIELKYLVFYYTLIFGIYFLARRFVQVNLIRFSRGIVYETRLKLFEKIFSTSYQKFEKIDIGRVYTALNEDVGTIGESTNMIVTLITSVFTAAGVFLYLTSIAFWATLLTVLLIGALSVVYYFVSRSTNVYFEKARDTRNDFMLLTSNMIEGFKELSLHRKKKVEYKADISNAADEYRKKISTAHIRFVNASLIGESLLIILLGAVVFAIPRLFPGIQIAKLMSFVIVLLYLIGPINSILSSVPALMQLKIAWTRIQQFLAELPANLDLKKALRPVEQTIQCLEVSGVVFRHGDRNGQHGFAIGPINLTVNSGEILFIIGGNGSGKTTLAKILTGLYEPDEGQLLIDGKTVSAAQLSEHYSAVFSPFCLFEKLYNIDAEKKSEDIRKYLKLLDLDQKVRITENKYSTTKLSGGQRKRLALLQCYLEDSPIYLFDEWAADQDPGYRNFFYRTLLPEMRKAGKIVIAITHDDHYFDVADKVLKMNHGKLEEYAGQLSLTTAL